MGIKVSRKVFFIKPPISKWAAKLLLIVHLRILFKLNATFHQEIVSQNKKKKFIVSKYRNSKYLLSIISWNKCFVVLFKNVVRKNVRSIHRILTKKSFYIHWYVKKEGKQ